MRKKRITERGKSGARMRVKRGIVKVHTFLQTRVECSGITGFLGARGPLCVYNPFKFKLHPTARNTRRCVNKTRSVDTGLDAGSAPASASTSATVQPVRSESVCFADAAGTRRDSPSLRPRCTFRTLKCIYPLMRSGD